MASFKWDKTGLFAAGVLFGTAGIKFLSSKDAKKVYTECTAAVLKALLFFRHCLCRRKDRQEKGRS